MDEKNFSGRVTTENFMRKLLLVLNYDESRFIHLFVNILNTTTLF